MPDQAADAPDAWITVVSEPVRQKHIREIAVAAGAVLKNTFRVARAQSQRAFHRAVFSGNDGVMLRPGVIRSPLPGIDAVCRQKSGGLPIARVRRLGQPVARLVIAVIYETGRNGRDRRRGRERKRRVLPLPDGDEGSVHTGPMPGPGALQEKFSAFNGRFALPVQHGILHAQHIAAFTLTQQSQDPVFPKFRRHRPDLPGVRAADRRQGGHGKHVSLPGQLQPPGVGLTDVAGLVKGLQAFKGRRNDSGVVIQAVVLIVRLA